MKAIRLTALSALALALAFALAACSGSDAAGGGGEPVALADILGGGEVHPHDLLVDREDPERLWLGVHGGLYRSEDGGRRWTLAALEGADAMNLTETGAGPFWVAGHNVLERSTDGGESFESVEPEGLPNLDLHGFTARAGQPDELVAAAAGEGLYRSRDGGESFELFSDRVGASVFGMSMTEDGTLYASDPQQGLIVSRDGGKTFSLAVQAAGLTAVAAGPKRSGVVMAGGEPGIVVSDDGGRTWERSFSEAGVAALAVAQSDPERAYAVGMDAVLYRSDDGGRSWSPVEEAEAS